MPSITAWVDQYTEEHPIGNVIDETNLVALVIKAANFYAGFAGLAEHLAIPIDDPAPSPPAQYPAITQNTNLTTSEWALIRPLFILYVEYENAIQIEASRGMGVDPFGRQSSEIAADITNMELEFPRKAFQRDVMTI